MSRGSRILQASVTCDMCGITKVASYKESGEPLNEMTQFLSGDIPKDWYSNVEFRWVNPEGKSVQRDGLHHHDVCNECFTVVFEAMLSRITIGMHRKKESDAGVHADTDAG